MDCKYKFSDIIEFLDGDRDIKEEEIFEQHFIECNKCQEELRTYDTIAIVLKKAYENQRPNCPSDDLKFDYFTNNSSTDDRKVIEAHFEECPFCDAERIAFTRYDFSKAEHEIDIEKRKRELFAKLTNKPKNKE